MSIQLFYHPALQLDSTNCFFDKEESQHIVKVLRKKVGDVLHITNGKGQLFEAQLDFASPKQCEVRILKCTTQSPRSYYLHLVVAPTKMNERCEHSERTTIKVERFEKILLSAMKQSLQCYLPKLNAPIASTQFFKVIKTDTSAKYIAHCYENEKRLFSRTLTPFPERITVLIGPEGDFSTTELNTALQQAFVPISLGDTRLRTETAAVVACHTVAVLNELQ